MNGSNFKAAGVNLFTRCPSNPIITTHNLHYPANSIFNAGAAMLDGWTYLVARVEDMRGLSHLTVLKSKTAYPTGLRTRSPSFCPTRSTARRKCGASRTRGSPGSRT